MKHSICLSLGLLLLCLLSAAFSGQEADNVAKNLSKTSLNDEDLLPSTSSVVTRNDSLFTVVCPAGSKLLPNHTHRFIVNRPSTDQFIRLKFNGTLGAIPKSSDFMGSGLNRVKVLDMSHQNIQSISQPDSDTFQKFRENIMYINLTFNAIVNVNSHAFDGFMPSKMVQVDLSGNAHIPCNQICLLATLRQPHIDYKGECTATNGERIHFSSRSGNTLNCQDLQTDETTPTAVIQSAVKVSYSGSSTAVYVGIGLVVCGILAVCIFTSAALLIIRRRNRNRNRENPRRVSRRVVNMNTNPIYQERSMSGASGVSGMSRSSENILYASANKRGPNLSPSTNSVYKHDDESSCEFHIYEEADAITGIRNVQNPVYDSSSE